MKKYNRSFTDHPWLYLKLTLPHPSYALGPLCVPPAAIFQVDVEIDMNDSVKMSKRFMFGGCCETRIEEGVLGCISGKGVGGGGD